jgi:cell division protein FtsZ
MKAEGMTGVEYIAVNTDAQALCSCSAGVHIQIGARLTRGLGSGGNPLMGQQAAEESQRDLATCIEGADMVFITGGMGGGTGTGAAPAIARLARDSGALTVAVVTSPFAFEGNHRRRVAAQGIEHLRPLVDTLIVVSNDRLLQGVGRYLPIVQAFHLADHVLMHGVMGIADMVTRPGLINVDFADVRAIMGAAGTAWMGIGQAHGERRVERAIRQALSSPLLDQTIDGAHGVLCNIIGSEDLGISEIHEGVTLVTDVIDTNANIIIGAAIDPTMRAGDTRVTLIATGFSQKPRTMAAHVQPERPSVPAPAHTEKPAHPAQPAPVARPASPEQPTYHDHDIPPFLRRRQVRRKQQEEAIRDS